MEITQKAPAKINLSLDALYRHGDGEHEWRMVMTSVDLADYVSIRPSARKISVRTDSGFVPEDARNLAFQAARILRQEAGINAGASIYIEKHIPVAAASAVAPRTPQRFCAASTNSGGSTIAVNASLPSAYASTPMCRTASIPKLP